MGTIMLWVWICVFAFALVVEIFTEAVVSVWFCFGAMVALASMLIPNFPFWAQIIVFFAVSIICFFVFRVLLKGNLRVLRSRTNIDAIIEKKGIVKKKITELESGEVLVDKVLWTAIKRKEDPDILEGEIVEVVSVVGNKLLVKRTK